MSRIPTAEDWDRDPAGSLAAALEVAKATAAHGDPTTSGIALGIAARVIRAAAPVVGQAVGGPLGALAGAAIAEVAENLNREHAEAVKALAPAQIALIDQAVALGVSAVTQKDSQP